MNTTCSLHAEATKRQHQVGTRLKNVTEGLKSGTLLVWPVAYGNVLGHVAWSNSMAQSLRLHGCRINVRRKRSKAKGQAAEKRLVSQHPIAFGREEDDVNGFV